MVLQADVENQPVKKISNKRVLKNGERKRIVNDHSNEEKGAVLQTRNKANYELLTTILEGKIEGKKAQGRQRRMWMDDIRDWLGEEKKINLLRACKDRTMWRTMVDNLRDVLDEGFCPPLVGWRGSRRLLDVARSVKFGYDAIDCR